MEASTTSTSVGTTPECRKGWHYPGPFYWMVVNFQGARRWEYSQQQTFVTGSFIRTHPFQERVLYRQPTAPNPLNDPDDFIRPALRHGSLNSVFQVALHLPSWPLPTLWCGSGWRHVLNLLPNNQRQRRTCYASCHILHPVSAAHTSILRMDSNPTSYSWWRHQPLQPRQSLFAHHHGRPPLQ